MGKIRPILFSTPMVQAILEGRKTQTRRVVPSLITEGFDVEADGKTIVAYIDQSTGDSYRPEQVAKYHAGDILWIRETWGDYDGKASFYVYRADFPQYSTGKPGYWHEPEQINWIEPPRWKPSIHMPREAARLFLRVTGVHTERLQDISESDARCEGVINNDAVKVSSYIYWFKQLWDKLNKKRGHGWDTNPWVWAYTFERCERPGAWTDPW